MNDHVDACESDVEACEPEDILGWAEFCCWVALVLMPFLQWVNGPSVSTDQAVVRTGLVVIASTGAIVLRIVNWRRKRQNKVEAIAENTEADTTEAPA